MSTRGQNVVNSAPTWVVFKNGCQNGHWAKFRARMQWGIWIMHDGSFYVIIELMKDFHVVFGS